MGTSKNAKEIDRQDKRKKDKRRETRKKPFLRGSMTEKDKILMEVKEGYSLFREQLMLGHIFFVDSRVSTLHDVPVTKKGRDECKRSKPIFSFLAYTMCP